MAKLLVIFGVTGQQGGAIAKTVLNDSELSQMYKIRGITRDPSKPEAQSLQQKGAEIVKGDIEDRASIKAAFKGAHSVFIMTNSIYRPEGDGEELELAQGKAAADEAVAAGAQQIIFSSLPLTEKITGGKSRVWNFDVKYKIEQYIRTLPVKATFYDPGLFMSNFHHVYKLIPQEDGSFGYLSYVKPSTKHPLVDVAGDTGKYVAPALMNPEKFDGEVIYAATRLYNQTEIAEILSKATGKNVKYVQISRETWSSFLPGPAKEVLTAMNDYIQEYGYFGPETEARIRSAAATARGELTTFEEYLAREPIVFG